MTEKEFYAISDKERELIHALKELGATVDRINDNLVVSYKGVYMTIADSTLASAYLKNFEEFLSFYESCMDFYGMPVKFDKGTFAPLRELSNLEWPGKDQHQIKEYLLTFIKDNGAEYLYREEEDEEYATEEIVWNGVCIPLPVWLNYEIVVLYNIAVFIAIHGITQAFK